ncbi:MAG TPA: hypothetical protein P5186_27650 [Candidatus Paceibacterota bacterium]|nr:hypothetical protein [Verrucomicrobiota bacterium]HRY51829.1 hypothetical protein [Candidatus Paceibacterota bacterium]
MVATPQISAAREDERARSFEGVNELYDEFQMDLLAVARDLREFCAERRLALQRQQPDQPAVKK